MYFHCVLRKSISAIHFFLSQKHQIFFKISHIMKGVEKQIKGKHLQVFTCTSCYHPPIKRLNLCEYCTVVEK